MWGFMWKRENFDYFEHEIFYLCLRILYVSLLTYFHPILLILVRDNSAFCLTATQLGLFFQRFFIHQFHWLIYLLVLVTYLLPKVSYPVPRPLFCFPPWLGWHICSTSPFPSLPPEKSTQVMRHCCLLSESRLDFSTDISNQVDLGKET